MKKKENWGGARPGAGKKNQNKRRTSIIISNEIADLLDKEPNKSAVVETALRTYYKKPKDSGAN